MSIGSLTAFVYVLQEIAVIKYLFFLIGPGHYEIKRWLQNTYLDSVTEYMVYFCGKIIVGLN